MPKKKREAEEEENEEDEKKLEKGGNKGGGKGLISRREKKRWNPEQTQLEPSNSFSFDEILRFEIPPFLQGEGNSIGTGHRIAQKA